MLLKFQKLFSAETIMSIRVLLFFLSGLFSLATSFCQSIQTDSLANIQVKNVIVLYDQYTDGNAPVYNGTQYLYYTFKMDGNPFFQDSDLSPGWISYRGKKYGPLSMLYDITRNEVVVLLPDSNSRAVLHNEFIDSFHLAGHTFISLREDHQQNLYNTGFYDVLYNGHVQLLARRTKLMHMILKDNPVVTEMYPKDFFYIHKQGLYYFVTDKKDVFRLLADKKAEIKKMMRRQHLKFRQTDIENTLTSVVVYYDQLID